MPYLLKGALIEYGSDFLGPLPNVVIFQFNPETLTRTLQIPTRNVGTNARETTQAGDKPIEKINFKAVFNASNGLNSGNILARTMGVGPQLAALEQMVHPQSKLSGLIGEAIDKIGSALGIGGGGGAPPPRQQIPRENYPRILFIWGPFRVLPVVIESMSIVEQQYDFLLNPVQAEVSIGLAVNEIDNCSDDTVARGALNYSNIAKEGQAILNLANTVSQAIDLIPF
ncbi:MAG TPA: hypothetical protein VHI13_21330 [Candidatus Kapabacteria bacterium]|nr:hypothetical protein [Candidatus Kapabacteria bacterium]